MKSKLATVFDTNNNDNNSPSSVVDAPYGKNKLSEKITTAGYEAKMSSKNHQSDNNNNNSKVRDFAVHIFMCVLSWCIFGIFVLPALVVILSVLYIVKYYIVEPWVKRKHPYVKELLNPYDAMLAHDSYYGPGKSYANLGQTVIMQGKFDVEKLVEKFEETLLAIKNSKGELVHEKLTVYPKLISGYRFWVPAKNFNIRDHIEDYQDTVHFNSSEEFAKFANTWFLQPYKKDKPLWEAKVFSFGNGGSLLAWKLHHCISDGLTFQKMFDVLINKERPVFKTTQTSVRGSFFKMAKIVLEAPIVLSGLYMGNMFHSDCYAKTKRSANARISWFTMSTNDIKSIRKKMDSHFAIAGLSIFAKTLKHYAEENYESQEYEDKYMNILLPLPWKKHPNDTMSNTWTASFIKTPFNIPNMAKWYQTIKDNLMGTIEAGAPAFTNYSLPFMTLVPNGILFKFLNSPYQGFSLSFSTVPGPYDEPLELAGSKIVKFLPIYGLQYRHAAITCGAYNYMGKTTFCIMGNEDIFPTQQSIEHVTRDLFPQSAQELLSIKETQELNGNSIINSHKVGDKTD